MVLLWGSVYYVHYAGYYEQFIGVVILGRRAFDVVKV
jgi:hypothetical protein